MCVRAGWKPGIAGIGPYKNNPSPEHGAEGMGSRGKYIWNSPGHPWLSSQEIPLGSEAAQACQELKGSSAWNRSSSLSNRSFSWDASALGALPRAHCSQRRWKQQPQGCSTPAFPAGAPQLHLHILWSSGHLQLLTNPTLQDRGGFLKLPEASRSFPAPSKPISSSIPVRGALDQSRRIFIPRN